jgi:hypothetical protein
MFTNFSENSEGVLKLASQNQSTSIKGSGDIKLTVSRNNTVRLMNALYVPTLSTNLISVARVTEKGFNATFRRNDAIISDKEGNIIIKAKKTNGLYYVQLGSADQSFLCSNDTIMSRNQKMGHLNKDDLKTRLQSSIKTRCL